MRIGYRRSRSRDEVAVPGGEDSRAAGTGASASDITEPEAKESVRQGAGNTQEGAGNTRGGVGTSRIKAPEGYWEAAKESVRREGNKQAARQLLDEWRAEDESKAAEYEQGRQRRSALSNVLRGYEALFNSSAVRGGGRYSEGAEASRAKDEQDRYARWAAERERRKDEYTRTRARLADMIKEDNDERLMRLRQAADRRADEEAEYKRQAAEREAERKRAEAEGKAALNAANIAATEARTEATRNKMLNDSRMTEIRAEQARSSNAANYARAKYYNEGGGRSGRSGSGGSGTKGVKVVTYGGRKRELPSNVNVSQMESAIIADMVKSGLIQDVEYKKDRHGQIERDDSGEAKVKRRKTRSELVAEMNRRWDDKGSNAEKIYKRYEAGSAQEENEEKQEKTDYSVYKRGNKPASAPKSAGAKKKKAPLGAKVK